MTQDETWLDKLLDEAVEGDRWHNVHGRPLDLTGPKEEIKQGSSSGVYIPRKEVPVVGSGNPRNYIISRTVGKGPWLMLCFSCGQLFKRVSPKPTAGEYIECCKCHQNAAMHVRSNWRIR